MNKRSLTTLIVLLLLGAAPLYAQFEAYTLYFEQPEELPCTGEQFCIDVTLEDWSDIIQTDFDVQWDSTVLQFVEVTNLNPGIPNLNMGDFILSDAGTLEVMWQEEVECENVTPGQISTLNDCNNQCRPVFFTICFEAVGDYGAATDLTVGPDRFTTKSGSCENVLSFTEEGTISTCVRPLLIDISDTQGNEGDLVCLDFYGSGIDDLSSFQFPIVWDSTLASFESIIVAQNLPNLTTADFGTPGNAAGVQEGSVTVAWSAPPPNNLTTVPDSTLLFQLCLRIEDGACGRDIMVTVADEQPGQPFFVPLATNDGQDGMSSFGNIAVGVSEGIVDVTRCDPEGIRLSANCGMPVALNDQVCVEVLAGDNFDNVTELGFLMEWNPNILNYTNVQNFNLTGLNAGDFNDVNAANGVLSVDWDGPQQNLAEGDVLFEVCFDAVGLGGDSPFRMVNNRNDIGVSNGEDIGINPTNCEVEVLQPDGVVIDVSEGLEGRPGDTLCFDFSVVNFTDMVSASFSINWETSNLQFLLPPAGIQNLNATAGVTGANFGLLGIIGGEITFNWAAGGAPVTLPDGDVLFTLCFVVSEDDADPGTCDQLLITNQPLEAEAITSTSNGEDIGLQGTNGNYCIVSPDGFWLVPDAVAGDLRDTICVPYKVGEFENITEADFSINWPPANLELIEIVDPGEIPGLNQNVAGQPVGNVDFDFTSPGGLTLPDSTVIFEACFELLGPADTCYAVTVADGAVVETTDGPGSLLDIGGEVCINNKIFIDSVIVTPESCPGLGDGSIRLVVSGGDVESPDQYGFSWQTSPPRFGNPIQNLSTGEYIVGVIDNRGTVTRDTIFVPVGGTDLFVDLGADRVASCDCVNTPNFVVPNVPLPADVPDVMYQWTATAGGQISSETDERIGLLCGPGTFILEVSDSAGCAVRDTMLLTPPDLPPVAFSGNTEPEVTCGQPEVMLSVDEVADATYEWSGPNGFTGTGANIMVQDSGTYVVTVELTTTACSSTDSITVDIDTIPPIAIASPGTDTTFLGCNDNATLTGFAGDDPTDVSVRWLDDMGNELTTNFDYQTNVPGLYFFEVTNTITGCVNIDSTIVTPDDDLPTVTIQDDPAPVISCDGDPVVMSTVVGNANPDGVTVEWVASNGGSLVPGTENAISASAATPGTYAITITEDATGCQATDVIEVTEDTSGPAIQTEVSGQLDCDSEEVLLDGSGSADGPNLTFTWFSIDFTTEVGTERSVPVGGPGDYIFIIRDTITQCESRDTVTVIRNIEPPVYSVGPGQTITCDQDTVAVATSVDLPEGDFDLQWTALSGGPIAEIVSDTVVRFDQPGEYQLIVENLLNGCRDTTIRVIEENRNEPEIVLEADSVFINCFSDVAIIDASASTQSDSNATVQYSWTAIEGNALPPFNQPTLEVEEIGVYVLTLTNVQSNCSVRDTAVVAGDVDTPEAVRANDPIINIGCTFPVATLDGTGSSTGDNLIYVWQRLQPGGTVIDTVAIGPDELTVDVSMAGLYQLRVFNTDNGCSGTSQQTQVNETGGVPPQIVFGDPTLAGVLDIDCTSPDTVDVSLSIANDTLFDQDDLIFEWSGGAVITGPVDPYTVGVTEPGIFTLMITDTLSGCVGENELVVNDLRNLPEIAFAEDSLTLNCETEFVTLDGSASAAGDTIIYQWTDEMGMELGTEATLNVASPGQYFFTVSNSANGCEATDTVAVGEDRNPPAVLTEDPAVFDCNTESVLLSAAPTGDAADFDTPVWSTANGGNITPNEGTLTANVDGPGEYQLTLISLLNGCDSTVIFTVEADTMPPVGEIAEPGFLGCAGQTVTLDASSFGNNGDFEISWSTQDGGAISPATGSLLVDVDAAGTYDLTVVNPENGCEAMVSATVELDPDTPEAVGTANDNVLGCGETLTLDGTGSSEGGMFDYEWIALGGGMPPIPVTDFTATVDAVGDYAFVVTNMNTGCSDTSEVVTIILDDSLPEAMAQVDSVSCDGTAFISGNLPAGTTGMWTSSNGATIADPAAATTSVTNLLPGENELTWTLSQEGCPDFSSTSIIVVPEQAPVAQDDNLVIPQGATGGAINLLDNDNLSGVSDFSITITEDPSIGTLQDNGNGSFGYSLNVPVFAPVEDGFAYEICNVNCPTLCDQAIVTVEIERDTTIEIETPNAITPNGDGMNDRLIFDQLLIAPDKFPNNSLIIFNRWGDIVYEAAPYNNDWEGTSNDGKLLPDGTYYYILRLEIGSGNILRGDITILK